MKMGLVEVMAKRRELKGIMDDIDRAAGMGGDVRARLIDGAAADARVCAQFGSLSKTELLALNMGLQKFANFLAVLEADFAAGTVTP